MVQVRYFNHDTNAMSDELMLQLRLEHGLPAVAAYWAIIEYIYSEEEPLPFGENQRETKAVLYRLGIDYEVLEKFVGTMLEVGLLVEQKRQGSKARSITSERAELAIEAYRAKAEAARQNGKKGGRPRKPKHNPEKTNEVISSVSEKNQSEKLTKTKTKGVISNTAYYPPDSASGGETAALSEVEKQRRAYEEMTAAATPCPYDYRELFDRGSS